MIKRLFGVVVAACAAIALMIGVSSCSDSEVSPETSESGARLAPSVSDYAEQLADKFAGSMDDRQREAVERVVKTGEVSQSDYEQALSVYRQCMIDFAENTNDIRTERRTRMNGRFHFLRTPPNPKCAASATDGSAWTRPIPWKSYGDLAFCVVVWCGPGPVRGRRRRPRRRLRHQKRLSRTVMTRPVRPAFPS